MPRFSLPTHTVFIPASLACNRAMPAACLQTWLQVRSLVQEGIETPPLSLARLLELAGKARSTFYRHLLLLKANLALDWRTAGRGLLIISFPAGDDNPDPSPIPAPRMRWSGWRILRRVSAILKSGTESLKSGAESLNNGTNCPKIETNSPGAWETRHAARNSPFRRQPAAGTHCAPCACWTGIQHSQ